MKSVRTLVFGVSASVLLLSGCGTTTTIYDPAAVQTNIREEGSVSSEEMRQVAVAAIQGAMTNAKFTAFCRNTRRR